MRGVTIDCINYPVAINIFQLTRLMRGVTLKLLTILCAVLFQLTRLMRGVTGLKNTH